MKLKRSECKLLIQAMMCLFVQLFFKGSNCLDMCVCVCVYQKT